jgi:hypothetical protein
MKIKEQISENEKNSLKSDQKPIKSLFIASDSKPMTSAGIVLYAKERNITKSISVLILRKFTIRYCLISSKQSKKMKRLLLFRFVLQKAKESKSRF